MGVKDELSRKSRSGVTSRSDKAQRFNDIKFVQYELSKEQSEACKAWSPDASEVWDLVEREVENGYKFTIKWDDYSTCYAAFMQNARNEHENSGLILPGRGSSASKALKQVLFKHNACLGGQWSEYVERRFDTVLDD